MARSLTPRACAASSTEIWILAVPRFTDHARTILVFDLEARAWRRVDLARPALDLAAVPDGFVALTPRGVVLVDDPGRVDDAVLASDATLAHLTHDGQRLIAMGTDARVRGREPDGSWTDLVHGHPARDQPDDRFEVTCQLTLGDRERIVGGTTIPDPPSDAATKAEAKAALNAGDFQRYARLIVEAHRKPRGRVYQVDGGRWTAIPLPPSEELAPHTLRRAADGTLVVASQGMIWADGEAFTCHHGQGVALYEGGGDLCAFRDTIVVAAPGALYVHTDGAPRPFRPAMSGELEVVAVFAAADTLWVIDGDCGVWELARDGWIRHTLAPALAAKPAPRSKAASRSKRGSKRSPPMPRC